MADIDESLYHDTRQNLIAAANGDDELIWLVEEQLRDMKETGYFNLEAENGRTNKNL